MKLKPYPIAVCYPCGAKASYKDISGLPRWTTGDYYTGKCGVCGDITEVTHPRGFQYPNFKGCELFEQSGIF